MTQDDELNQFLVRNRITHEDWASADIDFTDLKKIAQAHQNNLQNLNESAEFLAKILQKHESVHSVRWRVKDADHLMEKIVRKRKAKSNKYMEIDDTNYSNVITDLVGVRVLHLFKYEWEQIHKYITSMWELVENPTAYIRKGDEGEAISSYQSNQCEVTNHPAGYRSIHYVIATQPTKDKIYSEIQVRTIFEEGWSEVDHKIRYPNFSDNELISYFLTIFNRLAGSADEMGSFVKELTYEIAEHSKQLEVANNKKEKEINQLQSEQEEHMQKMEQLLEQLTNAKEQSKTKDKKLMLLQEELKKLKTTSATTTDLAKSNFGRKSYQIKKGLLSESDSDIDKLFQTIIRK